MFSYYISNSNLFVSTLADPDPHRTNFKVSTDSVSVESSFSRVAVINGKAITYNSSDNHYIYTLGLELDTVSQLMKITDSQKQISGTIYNNGTHVYVANDSSFYYLEHGFVTGATADYSEIDLDVLDGDITHIYTPSYEIIITQQGSSVLTILPFISSDPHYRPDMSGRIKLDDDIIDLAVFQDQMKGNNSIGL